MSKKALAAGDVVQAKKAMEGVDVGDIGVVVCVESVPPEYKVAWGAKGDWVTWRDREELRRVKVMGKGVRADVSGWA